VAQALNELLARGDFIAGAFVPIAADAADARLERISPRDFADTVMRLNVRRQHVEDAVVAARAAFAGWARLSLDTRKQHILALRRAIEARKDALALAITREVGKPGWEAQSEVSAALNKIDITLGDGLALVAPREMAPGQRYAFKPHGVAAVLGPFNFPLHLLHGHVVPLLVTGNTLVVKPSELAPATAQLYAECFEAAGFPAGVFNLVQGGPEHGALLAAHPDVDVVALTGSFAAGQAIRRATIEQPNKLLALELGGRNPALVLADTDLDRAVHDLLWGACVTAGQRCSGTAVALIERAIFPALRDRLVRQLDGVQVGDPLADGVFMGPLISAPARQRYLASLSEAERLGIEALGPARSVPMVQQGAYVAPSLHWVHTPGGSAYEREELFGPDLALVEVDDLDQAIALANASPYGLSASVFTRDPARFEHAFAELRYGCVNWNAPTCGASSRLPFGGTRHSGNHRPAALFSTLYATYPVASLQGSLHLDPASTSPGFTLLR
jgi:succinylglutamic semialdehyde dehydrogenase